VRSGWRGGSAGWADGTQSGPDEVGADIVAMARSGRMIEAIKMYRQQTGADLKQAKAAVEQAVRGY
jgi:ribosomal protein L7/L12